jgi:hypothetical protein
VFLFFVVRPGPGPESFLSRIFSVDHSLVQRSGAVSILKKESCELSFCPNLEIYSRHDVDFFESSFGMSCSSEADRLSIARRSERIEEMTWLFEIRFQLF